MKLTHLSLIIAAALLSGCAGTNPTRIVSNVAGATIGAFAGNKIGKGNAAFTAAGAGAGMLLGESLSSASTRGQNTAYASGYEKGRSDAVKQHYQTLVQQQRPDVTGQGEDISLFDLELPQRDSNGAQLAPANATLRIAQ